MRKSTEPTAILSPSGDVPLHQSALALCLLGLALCLAGCRHAHYLPASDHIAIYARADVFFHETIGHRLEAHRQADEKEGRTFKGQLNKRILPTFLSLLDDPTLEQYDGQTLNGHYIFDDEGVRAQRALLIEKGVLKRFLLGRKPVEGFKRSNGHGRAALLQKPIPLWELARLVMRETPTH